MSVFLKKVSIGVACILIVLSFSSCRSKGKYNPFLHMKKKPSEIEMKQNKRIIKKGNKAYKKHLGDNRKFLFGRRKAPGM